MTATKPLPPHSTAATIQHLINCGMTMHDIARKSGCHYNTIRNAHKPGWPVTPLTATRIAAVRASISPTLLMPALGATRRIQAAAAMGHTEAAFAAQARLKAPYISELGAGLRPLIFASTHDRIDAAYRVLLTLPAPAGRGASRAKNRARAAGWPTPEQWDGEIDNPDADPTAWMRNDNGRRTSEELAAEAEEIRRTCGIDWDLVAERLDVSRNTLNRARERVAARARREQVAA